jgi:hypothetical protein
LEVPDGALDKNAQAELVRSAKEQAVLKLYADDLVTTGEASAMLGLTRIQFLDLLQKTRLPDAPAVYYEVFERMRLLKKIEKPLPDGRGSESILSDYPANRAATVRERLPGSFSALHDVAELPDPKY